jgi:hypothetical protein
MKNYIGISRDHSGSMSMIAMAAARDYNDNIDSIKEGSTEHKIDTIVSVVKCGTGRPAKNVMDVVNSNVTVLKPLTNYVADGNCTPLFDSVMMLIDQLSSVPDANDPDVSFVVMTITDGQDNASVTSGPKLAKRIKELQATDRWTFVFRVPKGDKRALVQLGIPEGNILEWEQSERGVQQATVATRSAFKGFYAARSTGVKSTSKFYVDPSAVSLKEVKANLVDISKQVTVYEVDAAWDGSQIRDFVEAQGVTFTKGCAFYQLVKTETVQEYKQIAVRDNATGAVYSGYAARDLLGLPHYGEVKVAPAMQQNGKYEIYVQSTSVNRKLTKGMGLMIWVGVTV